MGGARALKADEWAWMVAELKRALDEVLFCLGALLAIRRVERQQAALAARPPVDLEAERCALAASVRANELDPFLLTPEDFGERLHRSLAAALASGEVTDDLAHGEVVGYLRSLLRDHDREADPLPSMLRVASLARQRRALRVVEDAVQQLRLLDCDHAGVVGQLCLALEHLEGG